MNQTSQLIHDLLLHTANLQHAEHADYDHDHEHDDDEHDYHDHENADEDQQQTELITAKATAMCVLFVASTICGCTPFILNRWFRWTGNNASARSATVVKCLLYFGGGVLLCTTFLHLVPEVSETIESLQECDMLPKLNFHLPHLLMCIGFLAMYFVEEIIHTYLHRYRTNADSAQEAFERGHSVRNSALMVKGGRPKVVGLSQQDLLPPNDDYDVEQQKYATKMYDKTSNGDPAPETISTIVTKNYHHGHGHTHLPAPALSEDMIVSSLRGLLVVLALSLHELFEGLAVGLESQPNRVWYMFGAVSAHKLVLAFCVGVELIVTRTKLWLAIVYVVTFAIVSPIGIGIGIYVSSEDNIASAIPSAILQGLASGTLLYVVFFEILSKERSGLIAYAAFVIGFCIMFGLQFATTSSEGHSHGGHCGGHGHSHGGDTEAAHHDFDHNPEHVLMVTTNSEKLKLIREATEELAHAIAKKIK